MRVPLVSICSVHALRAAGHCARCGHPQKPSTNQGASLKGNLQPREEPTQKLRKETIFFIKTEVCAFEKGCALSIDLSPVLLNLYEKGYIETSLGYLDKRNKHSLMKGMKY